MANLTATIGLAEANDWLAYLIGKVNWLALHTTDPTRLGDPGSEVTGGGYLRQRILFYQPTGGAIANRVALRFSAMPPVEVNYLALWSAQANGTMRVSWPIESVLVSEGAVFPVAVADLSLAL